MMRILLVSLVSLCFSMTSFASDLEPSSQLEQQTQLKLELQHKLQQFEQFQADFTQQVFDPSGELLHEAEGQLIIEKPAKIHWEQQFPEEELIVSNGETLWYYSPFIEQVSVYNAQQAFAETPILLLAESNSEQWQQYQVIAARDGYLLSHQDNQQNYSLWLQLDSNDQISAFEILDQSGQRNTFQFANFNNKPSYSADLFKFSVPDGVMVDDQR